MHIIIKWHEMHQIKTSVLPNRCIAAILLWCGKLNHVTITFSLRWSKKKNGWCRYGCCCCCSTVVLIASDFLFFSLRHSFGLIWLCYLLVCSCVRVLVLAVCILAMQRPGVCSLCLYPLDASFWVNKIHPLLHFVALFCQLVLNKEVYLLLECWYTNHDFLQLTLQQYC